MVMILQLGPSCQLGGFEGEELGSIEECRPTSCGSCQAPSLDERGRRVLVGHGRYLRQVRGTPGVGLLLVWIRRFLCLACQHTHGVLPEWLHPGRWYRADCIVETLWRSTILEEKTGELQQAVTGERLMERSKGWRTLTRWKQDLLRRPSLFGWLGNAATESLGAAARLGVLLLGQGLRGEASLRNWSREAVRSAATCALAGTIHTRCSGRERERASAGERQ